MTTATFESLEPRRVLSAVAMNTYEQYALELINRTRADPAAEAARLGIDLNEGLAPGTLSGAARQPLAGNGFLTDAARGHGDWLLGQGTFSHTGSGGSSPKQRMAAAGYTFNNPSGSAENLAVKMNSRSLPLTTAIVDDQHSDLFVDEGIAGRGHRKNMLVGGLKEGGIGYADSTSFRYAGRTWNAQLQTQNFAYSHVWGEHFLTGVTYDDVVRGDDFYTPGEQLAGVTITAVDSRGRSYQTASAAAGGYALRVPEGTYTVTATGRGIDVTLGDVAVGWRNVKLDFTPDTESDYEPPVSLPGWASLAGGVLSIGGTNGADVIEFGSYDGGFAVTRNGDRFEFDLVGIDSVEVYGKAGNDLIDAWGDVGVYLNGGDGDDTLAGSNAYDVLTGMDGDDQLVGRDGDDRLNGNAGDDLLIAGRGNDRLYGGPHHDYLLADAGDDRLFGENGHDRLHGGDGADVLLGGNHNDTLYGQQGDDRQHGQDGRDFLGGDPGDDLHDGGDGFDTVSYEHRTRGVYVSPTSDYARTRGNDGEPGEQDHVLDNIERLVGGAGDDTLASGSQATVIYGLAGNDLFTGNNGQRDTFHGGTGDDRVESDEEDVLRL